MSYTHIYEMWSTRYPDTEDGTYSWCPFTVAEGNSYGPPGIKPWPTAGTWVDGTPLAGELAASSLIYIGYSTRKAKDPSATAPQTIQEALSDLYDYQQIPSSSPFFVGTVTSYWWYQEGPANLKNQLYGRTDPVGARPLQIGIFPEQIITVIGRCDTPPLILTPVPMKETTSVYGQVAHGVWPLPAAGSSDPNPSDQVVFSGKFPGTDPTKNPVAREIQAAAAYGAISYTWNSGNGDLFLTYSTAAGGPCCDSSCDPPGSQSCPQLPGWFTGKISQASICSKMPCPNISSSQDTQVAQETFGVVKKPSTTTQYSLDGHATNRDWGIMIGLGVGGSSNLMEYLSCLKNGTTSLSITVTLKDSAGTAISGASATYTQTEWKKNGLVGFYGKNSDHKASGGVIIVDSLAASTKYQITFEAVGAPTSGIPPCTGLYNLLIDVTSGAPYAVPVRDAIPGGISLWTQAVHAEIYYPGMGKDEENFIKFCRWYLTFAFEIAQKQLKTTGASASLVKISLPLQGFRKVVTGKPYSTATGGAGGDGVGLSAWSFPADLNIGLPNPNKTNADGSAFSATLNATPEDGGNPPGATYDYDYVPTLDTTTPVPNMPWVVKYFILPLYYENTGLFDGSGNVLNSNTTWVKRPLTQDVRYGWVADCENNLPWRSYATQFPFDSYTTATTVEQVNQWIKRGSSSTFVTTQYSKLYIDGKWSPTDPTADGNEASFYMYRGPAPTKAGPATGAGKTGPGTVDYNWDVPYTAKYCQPCTSTTSPACADCCPTPGGCPNITKPPGGPCKGITAPTQEWSYGAKTDGVSSNTTVATGPGNEASVFQEYPNSTQKSNPGMPAYDVPITHGSMSYPIPRFNTTEPGAHPLYPCINPGNSIYQAFRYGSDVQYYVRCSTAVCRTAALDGGDLSQTGLPAGLRNSPFYAMDTEGGGPGWSGDDFVGKGHYPDLKDAGAAGGSSAKSTWLFVGNENQAWGGEVVGAADPNGLISSVQYFRSFQAISNRDYMNGLWNAFSDQTGTPPGPPQVSAIYPGTPFPTRCFPPASDDELSYDWGFTSSVPLFRVRTDDSGTTLQYGPGTGYPEQYNIAGGINVGCVASGRNTGGPCWPTVPGWGKGTLGSYNPCPSSSSPKTPCTTLTTTNAEQCCACLGASGTTPNTTSLSNIDFYTESKTELYTGPTWPISQTILNDNKLNNLKTGILACGSANAAALTIPGGTFGGTFSPCIPWDVNPIGAKDGKGTDCGVCSGDHWKHGTVCSQYMTAASGKSGTSAEWLWHNIFQWKLTNPLNVSRTEQAKPGISPGIQSTSPMFSMEAYDVNSCLEALASGCQGTKDGCPTNNCGIGDFLSAVPGLDDVITLFSFMSKYSNLHNTAGLKTTNIGPGTVTDPSGTMTGFERQTLYDCAFIPRKWLVNIQTTINTSGFGPLPHTPLPNFTDFTGWLKDAPSPHE